MNRRPALALDGALALACTSFRCQECGGRTPSTTRCACAMALCKACLLDHEALHETAPYTLHLALQPGTFTRAQCRHLALAAPTPAEALRGYFVEKEGSFEFRQTRLVASVAPADQKGRVLPFNPPRGAQR